jgi:hypothetical protein
MSEKVLRVEFRDKNKRALRLKAERFERDPEQVAWFRFLNAAGESLDTRVNAADVVHIVNEDEEPETSFGFG